MKNRNLIITINSVTSTVIVDPTGVYLTETSTKWWERSCELNFRPIPLKQLDENILTEIIDN